MARWERVWEDGRMVMVGQWFITYTRKPSAGGVMTAEIFIAAFVRGFDLPRRDVLTERSTADWQNSTITLVMQIWTEAMRIIIIICT